MKSLKIKIKETDMPMPMIGHGHYEEYPFWSKICIDNSEMGFDILDESDIGDEVMIIAKAEIVGIKKEECEEDSCIKYELQMCDMDIKEPDKFGDSFERAARKTKDSRDIEEG